ncbi:MAG TPA: SpoIIE family protein phosphatase [Geobacteraceae bacterium]
MKALIVDDNDADRKILRYIMERHDFEVMEAGDGEAGLAMAVRYHPSLIISDALMPKMDGFQFLRKVKIDPSLREIPFLFYSSVYTGCRDEQLALALGADAFVVKPKSPDAFWAEVSKVLATAGTSGVRIRPELMEEEEEYVREYSRIVTAKIEEKLQELERANAAIRQKARNYRNLYNSIRDVIIVTDTQHAVLDANQPALRETFGYENEEVLGMDDHILFDDEEGYRLIWGAFCETGAIATSKPVEVTLRKKKGEKFVAELQILKRIHEEGIPADNIVIIRDITERKRAEEAFHASEKARCLLLAELACAAEVQANLLPHIYPKLNGFEIAARCLPAHQVGGDFFDWLEVSPGIVALTLGDVMGNGMAAAMLMATVRATIHAVAQQVHPARSLQLAERALRVDLENSDRFVTLFHARLDTTTRTLTFVDCGHGHVFFLRADGRVEELLPRGLPLGIPGKEKYQEGTVTFNIGDTLVMYSDGLVDAQPDLSLDKHKLAERVSNAASAMEMVELLTDIPGLTDPPPDDLTVLVVRCKEPST